MTLMERRRALMGAQNKPLLPSEYQQLEWLRNYYLSGGGTNAYAINTNQQATYKTGLLIVCATISSDTGAGILGARPSDTGAENAMVIVPFSSSPIFGFGYFGTWYSGITRDTDFHTYSMSRTNLAIDGISYGTPSVSSGDTTRNIYIFGMYGHNFLCAQSQKVEYVEISQNDVVVSKLYPCYRKSDGKNGFYNTVDNTFLTCDKEYLFTRGPEV